MHTHPSLTFRGGTALAATSLLAFGVVPMASASIASPAAATSTQVTRNCAQSVDGERLRVRLKINFSSSTSNDVKSIVVRATDNSESGLFGNRDVNLRSVRIKVMNTARVTKVNRTSRSSPFSLSLSPTGSGRNALSISAVADWYVDGHRTVPVSCFFIDE